MRDSNRGTESRKVVLVTGQYYGSRLKAQFHFLADSFAKQGWLATMLTVAISPISKVRGDIRFSSPIESEANRLVDKVPNIRSYIWYTPWHPFHLRSELLNRLSYPIARRYAALRLGAAEALIAEADLIIYESTHGILLFDRFKRINPRARTVYYVSDEMTNLRLHPLAVESEAAIAPRFDLISAPSRYTAERFKHLPQARMYPHGLVTEPFDRDYPNPYPADNRVNAVSVGLSFFDHSLLPIAADCFPEWRFHIIGPVTTKAQRANLCYYGEMLYSETIPYIKHADIGLAPYVYKPGAEGLADSSLKLTQYTYCKLPAVAPKFVVRPDRPHIIGYRHGARDSIRQALLRARAYDRATISGREVLSVDRLVLLLSGDL